MQSDRSGNNKKVLVLEVVAEADSAADLTAARDIQRNIGPDFDVRIVRYGRDLAAVAADPAFRVAGQGTVLRGRFESLLNEFRPDIVHTHRPADLDAIGPAARTAGVPAIVHTVCGELATAEGWDRERMIDLVQELKPLLVVPAVTRAADLAFPAVCHVVPTGIDSQAYRPGSATRARRRIGLPIGPKVIGCASPAEHLELLFRALFRLDPDVQIALFGTASPGVMERRQIRRLGLEERVHVLGNWAAPNQVYRAIDVYFHGPSQDSNPRPVLAAQASGRPVVVTSPAKPECLCPQSGILLPAPFQPAVVGALRRALANTPAPAARQFIEANWNGRASIEAYRKAMREALGLAAARDGWRGAAAS